MWFLYGLSELIYILLYYIIGYRKKIVINNLKNSFPEASAVRDSKDYQSYYYRHFRTSLWRALKLKYFKKRATKTVLSKKTLSLIEAFYFNKKQSVILTSGHFNNWEWLITIQDTLLFHQAIGIGMPISQKSLDREINNRRSRFGMIVTHSGDYKNKIESQTDLMPYSFWVINPSVMKEKVIDKFQSADWLCFRYGVYIKYLQFTGNLLHRKQSKKRLL